MGLSTLNQKVMFVFALVIIVPELSQAGEGLSGLLSRASKNCLAASIPNSSVVVSEQPPVWDTSPEYQYYRDLHIELLWRLVGGPSEMTGDQRTLAGNLIFGRKLDCHSHLNHGGEVQFSLRVQEMMRKSVEQEPGRDRNLSDKEDAFLIAEIMRFRQIYRDRPVSWGFYAMDHAKTNVEIVEAQEILAQEDKIFADQLRSEIKDLATNSRPKASSAEVKKLEEELIAQAKAPDKILDQIGTTPAERDRFKFRQALLPLLKVGYFHPGVFAQALSQALMDLGADTTQKVEIALTNIQQFKKIPGIEINVLAQQTLKRLNELMRMEVYKKLVPEWDSKYVSDPKLLTLITQEISSPSPQLIRKATNIAARSGQLFKTITAKLTDFVREDGIIIGVVDTELLPEKYNRTIVQIKALFAQASPFEKELFSRQSLGRIDPDRIAELIQQTSFKELDSEFRKQFEQDLLSWKPVPTAGSLRRSGSIMLGEKYPIESFLVEVDFKMKRNLPSFDLSQKFAEYLKAEYEAALKDPVRGPEVLKKIRHLASKVEKGSIGPDGDHFVPKKYEESERYASMVLKIIKILTPSDPEVVSSLLDIMNYYQYPLMGSAVDLLAEKYFGNVKVKEHLLKYLHNYVDKYSNDEFFAALLKPFLTHSGGADIFKKISEPEFAGKRSKLLALFKPDLIAAKALSPEAKQWILSLPNHYDVSLIEVFEKSEAFELNEKIEGILRVVEPWLDAQKTGAREDVIQDGLTALRRLKVITKAIDQGSPYRARILKVASVGMKMRREFLTAGEIQDYVIQQINEKDGWDLDLLGVVASEPNASGDAFRFASILRQIKIPDGALQEVWDERVRLLSDAVSVKASSAEPKQMEGKLEKAWFSIAIELAGGKTQTEKILYKAILKAVGSSEQFKDRLNALPGDAKIAAKIKWDLKKIIEAKQ